MSDPRDAIGLEPTDAIRAEPQGVVGADSRGDGGVDSRGDGGVDPGSAIGLDDLAPGDLADVETVAAEPPLGTRLADLGFCPGTRVRVVRRAPLGDPVLYELRGYQIALRRGEASLVRVRRATP